MTSIAFFIAYHSTSYMITLIFSYLGLTFLILVLGYAGMGSKIFFKRPEGTVPGYTWLLHAPLFILNQFSFALYRCFAKQAPLSEVVPGLVIGRRLMASEIEYLSEFNIDSIVDLTCEFSEPKTISTQYCYKSLPLLDGSSPAYPELIEIMKWMTERASSGPIWVHCALGHGRSATIVIAYLMWRGTATTLKEAEELLRLKRQGIKLSSAQKNRLAYFAARLKTENVAAA